MMLPETSYVDREIEKLRKQIAEEYVTKLGFYKSMLAAAVVAIGVVVPLALA